MKAGPYAAARAATTLSGLAVLSPLAGMGVEMSLAWRFGTSPTVDAFRIGVLLLFFAQQLFVLQILPHTVLPVFTEYRVRGQEKEAWHVALSLGNLLLVPTLLVSLLVFVHPEPLVQLIAPGLGGEARATAKLFIRCFLLPYAPLVWSGVATGVLYAHRVFWLPPAIQLLGNLVLVTSILSLGRVLGARCIVVGVLLSAALGTALYVSKFLPLMRRAGIRFPLRMDLTHPGVRKTLKLSLPLLGVVLAVQWALVIVGRALSFLPAGNLAVFGYSWKLGLAVSIVPLSLATVLFPRFAETRFSSRGEEFREVCTSALRMALFIGLPLSAWLYALRSPMVAFLFERGAFSTGASESVSRLFGLLLLGAPAAVAVTYMEKMFYALGQTHILLFAQLGSALLLTALGVAVAKRFGAGGLMVLVVPVTAWLTAIAFFLVLHSRHAAFLGKGLGTFVGQVLVMAVASAWIAGQASLLLERVSAPPLLSLALVTVGGLAAGAAVFVAACLAWRVPEAVACSQYLRWGGDAILRRVQGVVGR
jgi:putative peptidoglycan lipid II flippase